MASTPSSTAAIAIIAGATHLVVPTVAAAASIRKKDINTQDVSNIINSSNNDAITQLGVSDECNTFETTPTATNSNIKERRDDVADAGILGLVVDCEDDNQVCVNDDTSSLGGRCSNAPSSTYSASNDNDNIPSLSSSSLSSSSSSSLSSLSSSLLPIKKSTSRALSKKLRQSYGECPATCPQEFCDCTFGSNDDDDEFSSTCPAELNTVCTDPDLITGCGIDTNVYSAFITDTVCPYAACLLEVQAGTKLAEECQCDYYRNYCNLYQYYCEVAECCDDQEVGSKGTCLLESVTTTSTTSPPEEPSSGQQMAINISGEFPQIQITADGVTLTSEEEEMAKTYFQDAILLSLQSVLPEGATVTTKVDDKGIISFDIVMNVDDEEDAAIKAAAVQAELQKPITLEFIIERVSTESGGAINPTLVSSSVSTEGETTEVEESAATEDAEEEKEETIVPTFSPTVMPSPSPTDSVTAPPTIGATTVAPVGVDTPSPTETVVVETGSPSATSSDDEVDTITDDEEKPYCVIVTTLDDPTLEGSKSPDGYVKIEVDSGNGYVLENEEDKEYAQGDVVLNKCFEAIEGIQISGPDTNGWWGSVMWYENGSYDPKPFICVEKCTGNTDITDPIAVDKNGNGGNDNVVNCLDGDVCTLRMSNDEVEEETETTDSPTPAGTDVPATPVPSVGATESTLSPTAGATSNADGVSKNTLSPTAPAGEVASEEPTASTTPAPAPKPTFWLQDHPLLQHPTATVTISSLPDSESQSTPKPTDVNSLVPITPAPTNTVSLINQNPPGSEPTNPPETVDDSAPIFSKTSKSKSGKGYDETVSRPSSKATKKTGTGSKATSSKATKKGSKNSKTLALNAIERVVDHSMMNSSNSISSGGKKWGVVLLASAVLAWMNGVY